MKTFLPIPRRCARRILHLATVVAICLLCAGHAYAQPYTYFYDDTTCTEFKFNQDIDTDGNVEIVSGPGSSFSFLSPDPSSSEPGHPSWDYTSYTAIGGDDWEYYPIDDVNYAYSPYNGWFIDTGYDSDAGTDGYSIMPFGPDTDFTYYYGGYAFDNDPYANGWYDEGLFNAVTGNWMGGSEAPGGVDLYIIGGSNWAYSTVDSNNYAYDSIIDQWYIDNGYDSDLGTDTWSTCSDPN